LKTIQVLQLIDSLAAGGAERMSLNLCNELATRAGIKVTLCATRTGGELQSQISAQVNIIILQKKHILDLSAFLKLKRITREQNIDIIHAHSSSIMWAMWLRKNGTTKIVWHDHFGGALGWRQILILFRRRIDMSIAVNRQLAYWHKKRLKIKCNKILLLKNFVVRNNAKPLDKLPGNQGRRIISLANFREQKDHITLLEAFYTFSRKYPQWSLLLAGAKIDEQYYQQVKSLSQKLNLTDKVFFLGQIKNITSLLKTCNIGVLSSSQEGLPLALLEYGAAGLPVIATHVGDCKQVIPDDSFGWLVAPNHSEQFANALTEAAQNPQLRIRKGNNLLSRINEKYSAERSVNKLLQNYQNLLQ